MKNKLFIGLQLLLLSCNLQKSNSVDKNEVFKHCDRKNYFCLRSSDSLVSSKQIKSIEDIFLENKLRFLKESEYWISFDLINRVELIINNDNGKFQYQLIKTVSGIEIEEKNEIVDNYISGLIKDLKKKSLIKKSESLTIFAFFLPEKWGEKNKFSPPPTFNRVSAKNSLYYISDNFDF